MSVIFNDVKIVSPSDDPRSAISIQAFHNEKYVSSNSDTSLNNVVFSKIHFGTENDVITLNNKVSFVTGESSTLPDGTDEMIGFEKVLINNNDDAVKRVLTSGHFGEGQNNINISTIQFDNSGNIYVGGSFDTFQNQVVNNIFRYNTDGSITRCGMGCNLAIREMLWDPSYNRLYVAPIISGTVTTFYQSDTAPFVCGGCAIYNPVTNRWTGFGANSGTTGAGTNNTASGFNSMTFLLDDQRNFLYTSLWSTAPSGGLSTFGEVPVNGRIIRVNRDNLADISDVISNSVFPSSSQSQPVSQSGHSRLFLDGNTLYAGGNMSGSTGIYNSIYAVDITTMPSTTLIPLGVAQSYPGGPLSGGIGSGTSTTAGSGFVKIGNEIYFSGSINRTPSGQYASFSVGEWKNIKPLNNIAKVKIDTKEIVGISNEDYMSAGWINQLNYDSARNKFVITGQFASVGNIDTKGVVWYDVSTNSFQQLTYGVLNRNFINSADVYNRIYNNKYYIYGNFYDVKGRDNGNSPYLVEVDPSKLMHINGNFLNNGQEVSNLQQIFNGQVNRVVWNGSKWVVKNHFKY